MNGDGPGPDVDWARSRRSTYYPALDGPLRDELSGELEPKRKFRPESMR